jgi:hypothetical protein
MVTIGKNLSGINPLSRQDSVNPDFSQKERSLTSKAGMSRMRGYKSSSSKKPELVVKTAEFIRC